MDRKAVRRSLFWSLLCIVCLSGCGGSSDPRPFSSLQIHLSTPKQAYTPGEPVLLTLVVKNVSMEEVVLYYGGGAPFVTQVAGSGQRVFESERGGIGALYQITFAPGETRDVSANALFWDQKDQAGNQVPDGEYSVMLWFIPRGINKMPVSEQEARTLLSSNTVNVTIR